MVGLKLCGELHDGDYKQSVPEMETILTAAGKVRLFVQYEDFHGWDLHAAWDDLRFNLKHYSDFERIAMVGDRKWEQWMANFVRPLAKAKVEYFDRSEVDAAWKWLEENDEEKRARKKTDRTLALPTEANRSSPWIWYGL